MAVDTLAGSRKAANLRETPRIALVVGRDDGQTAQVEGVVDEPTGAELRELKALSLHRFPDGCEREAEVSSFRVSPRWIRYSDFRATPPVIVVFSDFDRTP